MLTQIHLVNEQRPNKLMADGWQVMLNWGTHEDFGGPEGWSWEVDITKYNPDTNLWDNHQSGYSTDVNEAIRTACNNVRDGKRM